ncbi:winged helix-turn-helix domain-containing protein [Natronorubrum daqingense]|uniref:MarR family transcriptional regulator n=1 Tax=Natronorubrum daqingense TaxID=588898 RepID=A0A1N7BMZ2_9EURY|nr:winged helix-turn-helix domain-containing protein [Natronorubrum daqingense]APX96524.1 MarR family transcriptional regulator [Natronorubrum daqingense]SIR52626.1 Sugar-specific transcriptional regulator TrmB [Natronorubrum daqingense]
MLSKTGLKILDVLCSKREATAKNLAAETGHSRKQIYRVVDDLLEAGLVDETRRYRNQRVVRATDDPVVEAYRHLTSKLGHVDWPGLLSPATIRVCWYLDEPHRVTAIADRLGITRQAVHKALSPLKNRAMLALSGPDYALADDLQPLLVFVQEVVTHEHRTEVRKLAPSATVEWCDPKRALVHVQEPGDTDALQHAPDWEMTGLAKFQAYGLQFFLAGEPAFWYAPDNPLTPADIVCHTLVLEADSRNVSYAMLLIEQERIGEDKLTEAASWYRIESLIKRIYQLIEGDYAATDDVGISVPSDREYAALKEQYGVA